MKRFWIFRTIIAISSLAFIPVSLPSNAQGTDHHTMTANIPFGFELGSKHLAPGTYTVSAPVEGIVELRSGSDTAMILIHGGQCVKPTKTAKIVFDRYGDQYFLRQVWFNAEETTYLESSESKSEKQAKRQELASNSNSKSASNVELALLRLP